LRKIVLGPILATAEQGAGTHGIMYALLDPSIKGVSGVYISDSQLARPSTEARNPLVARDLWDRSCAMCKYTMPESCPADAL
jgi:WW domain-containing oxidoreductase